jgi:malate dehydrogenase (quinone)
MPDCDAILIGAGIMSTTVAAFLKQLEPDWKIELYEKLDGPARESTHARNNAGTGHSALCELNYTPVSADGAVDIKKAVKIMEAFETSKQWWAWLVEEGLPPRSFLHAMPHMSFVYGDEDVAFLRRRFEALRSCGLFAGMEFSDDAERLREWMPLVMESRQPAHLAATWTPNGTDVDFGALTCGILSHLDRAHGVLVHCGHEVESLERAFDGSWIVRTEGGERSANFVFIGAGGGALRLLEKSNIEEGACYGGFPVSGEWLVCKNRALVERHHAKVYGKAAVGTPPMSVPHLDSRYIDGEKQLIFGPFAGFSTKFLKEGSYLDLPLSVTVDNVMPLLSAGIRNSALTRYLIEQVMQSFEDKLGALRQFVIDAQESDWELAIAGQRVQVIKEDVDGGGQLEFGTEIVSAADNSIAALLGASPGASTSVSIALDLLADCFPEKMDAWRPKLVKMIPAYGQRMSQNPKLAQKVRARTHSLLGLL